MATETEPQPPDDGRGRLERALGVVTEVRPGETGTALLLTFIIFLVLTSYYIIKVLREAFLLSEEGGQFVKSYTAAGLAVLSIFVVKGYDWLYGRYPRMKLLTAIFIAFAAMLVGFFALYAFYIAGLGAGGGDAGSASLVAGIAFFLFVGTYGAFIIAVFWSFANDIYTEEQGKRLFPLVGIGSTAGGVVGAYLPGLLKDALGIEAPLLMAAGLLLLSLALARVVHARLARTGGYASDVSAAADAAAGRPKAKDDSGGFGLVFNNRYLLYLALLIMVLNWANSIGEFILGSVASDAAQDALEEARAAGDTLALGNPERYLKDWIGGFYSEFFTFVNIAVVAIQALVVSRFIKFFGVRVALFVLPCVALAGYAAMAIVPILGVVRVAKTAENATDYSLQNTTQQALFLVTSREEKYKAKAVIDTFFKRAGDVIHAGVIALGKALSFGLRGYVVVNIVLTLVWLALVILLGREHRKRDQASEEERTHRA